MNYKFTKIGDRDDLTNSAIEAMKENMDKQDDAYVGPFWYDPYKKEIYGYVLADVNDVPWSQNSLCESRVKTARKLHQDIWQKEYHRGKDKRFTGDYTQKPRGRVFQIENEGFVVFVGSWINNYPEAKQDILDVFQLPIDKTEFRIDSHWEIGHGWSQELL